jgi:hypothetical protein
MDARSFSIVVAVLFSAGCGGIYAEPAARPAQPRARLATSPETEALARRAQAIRAAAEGLNPPTCNYAPPPPICQATVAPSAMANRASAQLEFGPPPDVAGRVKKATQTLHEAEHALVAVHPPSGADCQGKAGPDRALAYQESCAVLDRVLAIVQSNDQAIHLDGSPDAPKVRVIVAACTDGKDTCFAEAKDLERRSKTGALAGEADFLVHATAMQIGGWSHGISPYNPLVLPSDEDLALAESLAVQAKDAAQQAVDTRAAAQAAEQAKMQAEQGLPEGVGAGARRGRRIGARAGIRLRARATVTIRCSGSRLAARGQQKGRERPALARASAQHAAGHHAQVRPAHHVHHPWPAASTMPEPASPHGWFRCHPVVDSQVTVTGSPPGHT